jgi:hypothetical protein
MAYFNGSALFSASLLRASTNHLRRSVAQFQLIQAETPHAIQPLSKILLMVLHYLETFIAFCELLSFLTSVPRVGRENEGSVSRSPSCPLLQYQLHYQFNLLLLLLLPPLLLISGIQVA